MPIRPETMSEYEGSSNENEDMMRWAGARPGQVYPFQLQAPPIPCSGANPNGPCPPGYSCYGGQCVQPVRETGPPVVYPPPGVPANPPPMWMFSRR